MFSASCQFEAAELILITLRGRQDQTQLLLLQMAGDVHPNPGPASKYHCPVCTRNVTNRRVSYHCNRCSRWVHAKCSGRLTAAQYTEQSTSKYSNDEETLLQRRQRTTLSQLRSGHCKLLNSYKKRLKQSDSSRCPDCGMDPQDVPHLFDCVAHPNDLSPVNLWDKPIETIRELSFLDPCNLN